MTDFFGVPVVHHPYIKKGESYMMGGTLYIGTWWKKPTTRSVVASQRRRRGK